MSGIRLEHLHASEILRPHGQKEEVRFGCAQYHVSRSLIIERHDGIYQICRACRWRHVACKVASCSSVPDNWLPTGSINHLFLRNQGLETYILN